MSIVISVLFSISVFIVLSINSINFFTVEIIFGNVHRCLSSGEFDSTIEIKSF